MRHGVHAPVVNSRPWRVQEIGDVDREQAWGEFAAEFTLAAATTVAAADSGWRVHLRAMIAAILARRDPRPDDRDDHVRAVGFGYPDGALADLVVAAAALDERIRRHAREALDGSPYRDPFLLTFLSHHQAWSDWALRALVAGHRAAKAVPHCDLRARDFVERIVTGTLTRTAIEAGIAEFGLDEGRCYHALHGRFTGAADLRAVERDLRLVARSGRRTGLVATVGGDVYGFVSDVSGVRVTGFTAGISRPTTLDGVPRELRVATRALQTALRSGLRGLVRLEDAGLWAAVVTDSDVTELLLRRYVEPFGGAGGADVLETVERYLANGRRPGPTGRDLYIHTNTVRYRLSRFEAVTGRSLQDARTMVEVWWALQARRIRAVAS
jgi:hypothetical protein